MKILFSKSIFLITLLASFAFGKAKSYSYFLSCEIKKDSIVKLIIDPLVLKDKDKALFVRALTALAMKKHYFDTINVVRKQTVNKAITGKSKYPMSEYKSFGVVVEAVKSINDLNDDLVIYTNQKLYYPRIPVQPNKNSTLENVQVFDIEKRKQYVQDSKDVIDGVDYTGNLISNENARLWMYKITKEDLTFVLNEIPVELRGDLISHAYLIDDGQLHFNEIYNQSPINDQNDQIFQPINISNDLRAKLKEINIQNFGKYYILDNYTSDSCSHGNNVINIIKQRLRELELDLKVDSILPIQINLLEDIAKSIRDIETIVKESENLFDLHDFEIKMQVSKLKKLTKQQISDQQEKCKDCISDFFLDLFLKYYYSKKPDLLSTSLYVRSSRSVKPIFTSDSETNLITAALNDNSAIENILLNASNLIEPLNSCYTSYQDFGSIIVGNNISTGKFAGSYSDSGRVSTLGIGGGYPQLISCYGSKYTGTSFATPDVAVKLFVAKAYWRSKEIKPFPNAIESRRRMLLSSDIQEGLIGKFASAGIPNLEKMLVVKKGFTEGLDGKISEEVEFEMPSTISYNSVDKCAFNVGNNNISGLSFINNRTFAFFEKDLVWKEITIDNIDLKMKIGGISQNFNNVDELRSQFKQIVKLKN
jgi:hypothetical protein